ncbi:hypothetical protein JI574_004688 [Salmonella enterica]|nr:hypothetical protein [Salmonella enterica]EGJ8505746.1 hypothetical protein [Salmonella enterica]EGY8437312.1 hypothetical protein [Salmonella enterica]EID4132423.1 hypothetical protein [Salmonella enterica]EIJ9334930.1 hypothetical protein [Salmonella enterica]
MKLKVPNNVAMPIIPSGFISMYWFSQNTAMREKTTAIRMLTPHVAKLIITIAWLVSIVILNFLLCGNFLFLEHSTLDQ